MTLGGRIVSQKLCELILMAKAIFTIHELNHKYHGLTELTTGDEIEELGSKDISELKELVLRINEFPEEDNMAQQHLANPFEIELQENQHVEHHENSKKTLPPGERPQLQEVF
ncbi:hypothetical protein VNO77_20188 [Canavalia gladiata]|uniref:Uncharacterized protein n=1 Tax=Canavalia gladiata TaxID=3824 RepID=A0AAN9QM68_CANGL